MDSTIIIEKIVGQGTVLETISVNNGYGNVLYLGGT